MDDLLSAAICEAGLEEFLLAPESVNGEIEKSENDISIGSINTIDQTKALVEFPSGKSESEDKKQNVEILSDGCITLPSCSQTDSESNSRSDTPRIDDPSNNITENAPSMTIQDVVEVVETGELPSDLSVGNTKQAVLSQSENIRKLPSDGNNILHLRRPVTSTQQRLQPSSVMVNFSDIFIIVI